MLELLRRIALYPTISSTGERIDGLAIQQPIRCRRCKTTSCREQLATVSPESLEHAVCEFDYSLLSIPSPFGPLWMNGLFVPFRNSAMNAATKKANRSQKVTWEEAVKYAEGLKSASPFVTKEIQDAGRQSVAGLHDIHTAVGLVLRNAQAIIHKLPGWDDFDRIQSADPDLKCLLKSVNLLKSRLSLATLVANPESASYGQPRPRPVYRAFHLMVRLFEEEAARRHVRLNMTGRSINTPKLFDSFETIPLVLVDNAVKYASDGSDITVNVFDQQASGGCAVSVESVGCVVKAEDRSRIFDRGFRATEACNHVSAGSGLGLYIGQIVARANGTVLKYEARDVHGEQNIGKNVFLFSVRGFP